MRPAGPRLLLIDPHPLILAALSGLLTGPPLHAQVHVASSTALIEEWLAPGAIDLVLCDRRVEPVPALELAQRLSELPEAIPMILLGDTEDEGFLLRALDSPFRECSRRMPLWMSSWSVSGPSWPVTGS